MKNSENKPISEEKDPDFSTFTSRIHPTSELSPMAKAWLEKGTDDDDEATAIRRKEEAEAEEELNKGLKRMSRANILGIKGHLGRMGLGPDEFGKNFDQAIEKHRTTQASLGGGDPNFDKVDLPILLKIKDEVVKILSGDYDNLVKESESDEILISNSTHRFLKTFLEGQQKFFNIFNETERDITEMMTCLNEFLPFSQKEVGYDRPVTIRFISDPGNAQEALGKTAFYNPTIDEVAVYVDGRHPKDMMRSISHELVHHAQNCRGEFDDVVTVGEGPYMQRSEHLSEMEREAYEVGNMTFRIWEDNYKHNQMENKKMKIDEQTLRTVIRGAIRKMISEGVEREAGDASPLTPEEIRAFLAATGREELTRYVQGDPELHRAPGTKSPYDKSEPEEAPPEGVDLEDPDVVALAATDEEEVEVTQEGQTNREWYNNTLSETLVKRWTK